MKKTISPTPGYISAGLALACLQVGIAQADDQSIPYTLKSGTLGSCPGSYAGYAKMTNSTGGLWITPPANTTGGTLTDASGFPPPYLSTAYVQRKSDLASWCATNSVSFPATNSTSYELAVYVKSTSSPPTNTQPLVLQITWH